MHRSICGNHGFSEGEWAMMVNYALQIAIERMSSLTWKLYNALSVVCFVLCCETYVNCFQCHWTGIIVNRSEVQNNVALLSPLNV